MDSFNRLLRMKRKRKEGNLKTSQGFAKKDGFHNAGDDSVEDHPDVIHFFVDLLSSNIQIWMLFLSVLLNFSGPKTDLKLEKMDFVRTCMQGDWTCWSLSYPFCILIVECVIFVINDFNSLCVQSEKITILGLRLMGRGRLRSTRYWHTAQVMDIDQQDLVVRDHVN